MRDGIFFHPRMGVFCLVLCIVAGGPKQHDGVWPGEVKKENPA